MIVVALLLGCGAGAGAWLLARGLAPRPEALGVVLGRLAPAPLSAIAGADARLAHLAQRTLAAFGMSITPKANALRLVGRSTERHALDKLVGLLGGAGGSLVLLAGLRLAGMQLPVVLGALATVAMAAGGFVLPDVALAEEANRKRKAFRHALGAYLDLVNVILAGGGGIESALHAAADAGDGWAFEALRRGLDRARLTGRSPWDVFAELGRELDVPELVELAANVSLAGSHGARIRHSLAAKADTLRGHQVAETEAAAEAATERMTIPVAVLLFGFLVFIAYPAVIQITTVSGASP